MQLHFGSRIISGIEPIDELMGGLDRGQLYLVHGDASGMSLFAIKFLIEGLKKGENCALVIRYSPEEAVRRFARLGYDCLEDVYSGRLVILEHSDDIIQKIGNLRELTPVLRELEWLLGETRPERLIFDPVASVIAGAEGNLEARAREFAEWAVSFGATVLLIANESFHEIIECFEPLVAESFRFDVRDIGERTARFISFERSSTIPDQAIEVDPSRGVFLLGRAYESEHQAAPKPPSIAELESIREELRAASTQNRSQESEPIFDIDLMSDEAIPHVRAVETPGPHPGLPNLAQRDTRQTTKLTQVEEMALHAPRTGVTIQPDAPTLKDDLELQLEELVSSRIPAASRFEAGTDELSELLDDITGASSPLDLDLPELRGFEPSIDQPPSASIDTEQPAVGSGAPSPAFYQATDTPTGGRHADPQVRGKRRGRASDVRIDSTLAARAVELLLHPPDNDPVFPSPDSPTTQTRDVRETTEAALVAEGGAVPADCSVLIIGGDAETRDIVTQTLGDYSLEVVHDGVSGLAKLISLKPDLVVLDFDLPVIDGFKVLTLIRSALNVPIIVVSGLRIRAIDRVMAAELGADYYLTKPFSAKELRHKARQLIARYRGLSSWIINSSSSPAVAVPSISHDDQTADAAPSNSESLTPYTEFAAEVDKRVKASMDNGAPFSIVGCRLPLMAADGGRLAQRLFEIVRGLARDSDLTSTNQRNDLVIMLADAGADGARAFLSRLRARAIDELNQEPALWMRSFPDLDQSTEAAPRVGSRRKDATVSRRSSDQRAHASD